MQEGRYGAGGETTHMGLQAMHERDGALRTPRSTRRSPGARGRAWEAINNHPAAEGQTGSWTYCIGKGSPILPTTEVPMTRHKAIQAT
ncbi:hypothetical protein V6N13_109485 [Hibiscus sabdariffa]